MITENQYILLRAAKDRRIEAENYCLPNMWQPIRQYLYPSYFVIMGGQKRPITWELNAEGLEQIELYQNKLRQHKRYSRAYKSCKKTIKKAQNIIPQPVLTIIVETVCGVIVALIIAHFL